MPDLLCGTAAATSKTIRFVATDREIQAEPVEVRQRSGDLWVLEVEIKAREWDVTDREARETVGRELLGDAYEAHCAQRSAQWFIEPGRNAAGLLVYRALALPFLTRNEARARMNPSIVDDDGRDELITPLNVTVGRNRLHAPTRWERVKYWRARRRLRRAGMAPPTWIARRR